MVIQRGAKYIKFVASVATNGNKSGDVLEAWKDYAGWHIRTVGSDKVYQTTVNMIRTIAGRCITQREDNPFA